MVLLTGYWCLDAIVVVTTITIVGAYLYMTRNFGYWKKRGVMEISPTPFVGNFGDFVMRRRSPSLVYKDLYDKSRNLPYMGFYIFDTPFFLIRDPELIKNVLVRDFNYFSDRYISASPDDGLGKGNLFTLKNPTWKFVRSKLASIFSAGKLKKMFELMLEVAHDLESHLKSLDITSDGRTVEVKEICAKFMTDIIGTTAYGLKVNSLNNPEAEFRRCGRAIFECNLWRSMELTALLFAPHIAKPLGFKFFSSESTKFLREVFWETIVKRENSGVKRNDLIDLLIELKKSQAESSDNKIYEFDGDNLVAQAAIFFIGGFETSSTVLSFTLYELALNPDVQTKLRAEIADAIRKSDGKITYDMVMTLPYLDMVVSEALRKYPPLHTMDRQTTADYTIPDTNIVLEKGVPVYIPMFSLHYDPEYFPNPEVFDPERFNEENKRTRKPFTYMPFGEGPHICIALRLGLLQVKLGLVHVLMHYEISPCQETMIPIIFNAKSMVTASDGGVFLNFRKITIHSH